MSVSRVLMAILLLEYAAIAVVCLFEKDWVKALYWVGASVLQIAVLFGMR